MGLGLAGTDSGLALADSEVGIRGHEKQAARKGNILLGRGGKDGIVGIFILIQLHHIRLHSEFSFMIG